MNLQKLFETQKALDEAIVKKKGLEGQNLLPQKILALQVELGECANEWRGFKFWSEDQKARDFVPNPDDICEECKGDPIVHNDKKITGWCDHCDGCGVHYHNPLLEEYVDCLHFILSIGTHHYKENEIPNTNFRMRLPNVTYQFTELFMVDWERADDTCGDYRYETGLRLFLALGEMLGFSDEEIEQAYYEKNEVNHSRQANGY